MRITHFADRLITATVFAAALLVILLNFHTLFPALKVNSLKLTQTKINTPIDIPSNLNFLTDDKKRFVDYFKKTYGEKLPFTVDNDSFFYYGSIDGDRLYRLQPSLIPNDPVQQHETLGGHVFYSDCTYRPSKTGLYIIGDQDVYTLEEAYSGGVIDIDDVYTLYRQKMIETVPSLKNVLY